MFKRTPREVPGNMAIINRLKALGKTQIQVLIELQNRGVLVSPSELSLALREINKYPKDREVYRTALVVIEEWEDELRHK